MKKRFVLRLTLLLAASIPLAIALGADAPAQPGRGAGVPGSEPKPNKEGVPGAVAASGAALSAAQAAPELPPPPRPQPPAAPIAPAPPRNPQPLPPSAARLEPALPPRAAFPAARPVEPATAADPALANGIFEEESNLNLEEAINSYQSVISGFDSQRAAAANAVFRLGECYRKLGRIEEAKTQYARILREFPDQVELAKLSQKYLFGDPLRAAGSRNSFQQRLQSIVKRAPSNAPEAAYNPYQQAQEYQRALTESQNEPWPGAPTPAGNASPGAARQQKLLDQEIKLVLQQIDEMKKRVANGTVSSAELFPLQKELLELQRKSAALDDAVATPYAGAPAQNPRPPRADVPGGLTDNRPALSAESGRPGSLNSPKPNLRPAAPGPARASAPRPAPVAGPGSAALPLADEKGRWAWELAKTREQVYSARLQWDDLANLLEVVRSSNAATLPDQASADPRYQKLKQDYERVLLDAYNLSEEDRKKREESLQAALSKLETWVHSIYLPELQAKRDFAEKQVKRQQQQAAELETRLKKAQAEEAKMLEESATAQAEAAEAQNKEDPAKRRK